VRPDVKFLRLKCTKFDFRWGPACSDPPDLLAVFKGPTSKGGRVGEGMRRDGIGQSGSTSGGGEGRERGNEAPRGAFGGVQALLFPL